MVGAGGDGGLSTSGSLAVRSEDFGEYSSKKGSVILSCPASLSLSGAISGGGVNGGSGGVNGVGVISGSWERIAVDCTRDFVWTRFLDAALRLFDTGCIKLRVSNKMCGEDTTMIQ